MALTLSITMASVALAGWQGFPHMQSVALTPAHVNLSKHSEILSVPPIVATDTPLPDDSWHRSTPVSVAPWDAAKEFLSEMMEYGAGGTLLWKHISHAYQDLARSKGWPDISDKTLSKMLVKLGCKRGVRDTRVKNKRRRMTTLTFPLGASQ